MKDTVVVFGYPKSGNTWLARLVGELVGCPVKGYYKADEEHRDVVTEGEDRMASQTVWKGHQRFAVAARDFGEITPIYVVRDVRDVAISGAHYYTFPQTAVERALRRVPMAWRVANRLAESEARNIDRMSAILDRGTEQIAHLGLPWDLHAGEYLDGGVFHVRYEDLIADPQGQCRRIAAYLEIERSERQIAGAIERQSFANVKKKFAERGDERREKFMREGRAGQWTDTLSARQRRALERRFGAMLERLGYPLGDAPRVIARPRMA